MNNQTLEIRAYRDYCRSANGIVMQMFIPQSPLCPKPSVCTQLVFKEVEPCSVLPEPVIEIGDTQAQMLMDSLWNCGIRPTDGAGTAGSMAAVQEHLKDMREQNKTLLRFVLSEPVATNKDTLT